MFFCLTSFCMLLLQGERRKFITRSLNRGCWNNRKGKWGLFQFLKSSTFFSSWHWWKIGWYHMWIRASRCQMRWWREISTFHLYGVQLGHKLWKKDHKRTFSCEQVWIPTLWGFWASPFFTRRRVSPILDFQERSWHQWPLPIITSSLPHLMY